MEAEGEADTVVAEPPNGVARLDGPAVEAEGDGNEEEDGALLVPNFHAPESAPPPRLGLGPAVRAERCQHTIGYFKMYVPEKAGLVHDSKIVFRFVVTLDPRKLTCDPRAVDVLPPKYKQVAKSFPFGRCADTEKEDEIFARALEWVWEKYVHLMGGKRPDWSYPFGPPEPAPAAPTP